MRTCFMSHLLVLVLALVLKELALALVLLQLVLTTTLHKEYLLVFLPRLNI